ncbi:response regulator [Mucilaginibacter flavidus]|uniref:response regulator n=1 Tax=Mucilaginibacter flavidus TaxID=2949309 RepID=UPI0020936628|nr:response regulator [Mucilaginibacter flavidus]MCO5949471.1 response regulator [Mucilaginibacter flavidus]
MFTSNELFIDTGNTLLIAFYVTWWFYVAIFFVAFIVGYFYHRLKIEKLLNRIAEQQSEIHQKDELLTYARRNEQIARGEAQAANANKSLLLSQISHDIRTPMTTLMGMASLLTETSLTPEQQEYTSAILLSGESLLGLINDILMKDILEYSKVHTGKELDVKEFNLRNSIEEVFDVFAVKAAHAGLDLVYRIENKVPVQIVGDNQRFRQILMNLVENAVRFTHRGQIYIGVQFIEADADNRVKLKFEVKDSGIGISEAKIRELSRELMQTTPLIKVEGTTGVGLVICKNLVMLMGGTIAVDSVENKGTSFQFTMTFRTNVQPLFPPISIDIKGKKVLIIDDNASVRDMLRNRFEGWNMILSEAGSGNEALEILSNKPDLDLIITDLQMPEMDGITLTQSIQKLYPNTPVMLLNSTGNEDHKKHPGLFSSVINKPIRRHILKEQVISMIRQTEKVTLMSDNSNKQKLSVDFAKQNPLSILVAEDNIMNQKIVGKILNKLGYEPKMTNNGKEVLEEVSNKYYDVILMDVQMPEMDGLEATKMIRICLTNQPVIIAMTANTLQGDREVCLRAGMNDYLAKPINLGELVNLLEKWAIHSCTQV